MRRPWKIVAAALALGVLLGGGLAGNRLLALSDETRENLRLYTELLTAARENFGGDVDYRDLVYASIHGMVRTLDPHTNFLQPSAFSNMREKQQASFFGLGILVGIRNGKLTVITPIEGTPASRLGIRAGDVIQRIEGEATDKLSIDEAVSRLKGPKDTQVQITIVRVGLEEPLELTVTRAEIPQTTVRYAYMIEPGTGYLAISDFSRSTGDEVDRALEKLRGLGMKRLVIDLRNNGGGLLDQAIEVADQFLPEDSTIVETRGRTRDSYQSWSASGKYPALDLPVVVLVNEGTASAAEILSGAIQDHDRGLLVGQPSWGKGLVQTVYNLSYGAGLALTTAKYYTPSGRLIQRDYTSYYDYYTHADAGSPEITGKQVDESEIYRTDLGRKVYGGGGITPDVLVKEEELTPFEQFLLARNAYLNFAVDYAARNKSKIKSAQWAPGPEVLEELRGWLVKEKIATDKEVEEAFAQENVRKYSLLQIRAEVLNIPYGQEARHRVLSEGDTQIQSALGLFGKAAELQAQRRELPPRVDRADADPKGRM
jgi:carboxyl-terminal processing protease